MGKSEPSPLQVLNDTVEDWLRSADQFYEELQARLGEAQQQLAQLEGGEPLQATVASEMEEELSRLREQVRELSRANDDLQQQTKTPGPEQAGEESQWQQRVSTLEGALKEERQRVNTLQRELEEARAAAASNAAGPAKEEPGVPEIRAFDSKGHKKRIGNILVDEGIVTPQQLQGLLAEQAGAPHVRLGMLAIERGYTSDALVAKVLAAQLRLPYVDLHQVQIEPKTLELLSSHLARLHRSLPLRQEQGRLVLAMANPLDLIAIEDIELATRLRVDPVVASAPAMETALERFYPQSGKE